MAINSLTLIFQMSQQTILKQQILSKNGTRWFKLMRWFHFRRFFLILTKQKKKLQNSDRNRPAILECAKITI